MLWSVAFGPSSEPIHHDFLVAAGQYPSRASARAGCAAWQNSLITGEGGFLSTRHPAHVDIQKVQAGLIVVSGALTVLTVNHVHRLLHLLDRRGATGVQRPLHHRLLGTEASSKRSKPHGIGVFHDC